MTNPFRQLKAKCQTCGEAGALPQTKLCNNCWEVEKRLDDYLDTNNGVHNVISLIKQKGLAEACLGPLLIAALKESLTVEQEEPQQQEESGEDLEVEDENEILEDTDVDEEEIEETDEEDNDDWSLDL